MVASEQLKGYPKKTNRIGRQSRFKDSSLIYLLIIRFFHGKLIILKMDHSVPICSPRSSNAALSLVLAVSTNESLLAANQYITGALPPNATAYFRLENPFCRIGHFLNVRATSPNWTSAGAAEVTRPQAAMMLMVNVNGVQPVPISLGNGLWTWNEGTVADYVGEEGSGKVPGTEVAAASYVHFLYKQIGAHTIGSHVGLEMA